MYRYLLGGTLLVAAAGPATAQMKSMNMPDASNPASKAYLEEMSNMHDAMMGMKPTNDASRDFVMMMKPHHEAAVQMAQTYLKYGKDPELRKMAESIVADQEREIKLMTQWQIDHEK